MERRRADPGTRAVTRRDSLDLRDYLEHIQQALERIDRYLREIDYVGFLANEEKQDAVLRNLEVIGEAAGNVRRHFPEFSEQYPDFPLRQAYETRNVLAHGYFKVDLAESGRRSNVTYPIWRHRSAKGSMHLRVRPRREPTGPMTWREPRRQNGITMAG
jgi:uncharacterized protein with HEPN domain